MPLHAVWRRRMIDVRLAGPASAVPGASGTASAAEKRGAEQVTPTASESEPDGTPSVSGYLGNAAAPEERAEPDAPPSASVDLVGWRTLAAARAMPTGGQAHANVERYLCISFMTSSSLGCRRREKELDTDAFVVKIRTARASRAAGHGDRCPCAECCIACIAGTTYGGDGVFHLRVADLRGRVPMHREGGVVVDDLGKQGQAHGRVVGVRPAATPMRGRFSISDGPTIRRLSEVPRICSAEPVRLGRGDIDGARAPRL